MHQCSILLLQLLSLVAAASLEPPIATGPRQVQNQSIEWGPCSPEINNVAPIVCGNLTVPLDYTDPSNNITISLDILRLPAAKTPSKGSILLNDGGPGSDGFGLLGAFGEILLGLTGGYHDLIVVAPRGTGRTLTFSCHATLPESELAFIQYPFQSGKASSATQGRNWATGAIVAETCFAAQNKTGAFIGTAFVARDMMQVVDALEKDGMLRYWGISYGSVLGATMISMFPDRVDKVILDGVVNAHEYYDSTAESQLFSDTDDVFAGFCAGCVAAPENCTLAHNRTAHEIEETILDFLETLKYNPFPIFVSGSPALIDYSLAQGFFFSSLYYPQMWPELAVVLDKLLTYNPASPDPFLQAWLSAQAAQPFVSNDPLLGIKCSDKVPRKASLADLLPDLVARYQKSRTMGDAADSLPVNCAQWKMQAKERYGGDFKLKTKNPVLLIGNTFDPVTPIVGARNMSAGFEKSVVLEHNGYGHCSYLTQASLCTARATKAYFTNGTLPKHGTVCPLDVPLFSGETGWAEVAERVAEEE